MRAPAAEALPAWHAADAAVAADAEAAAARRAAGLPVVTRDEYEASLRGVRDLPWPGAFNSRDLGGTPVAGGSVRPGVLYRSGQPEAWAPQAWREAAAGGVRRVLDLRDEREPRSRPDGAAETGIGYAHAAVDDPDDVEFRRRFVPYLNHTAGYAGFLELFGDRGGGGGPRRRRRSGHARLLLGGPRSHRSRHRTAAARPRRADRGGAGRR